MNLLLAAMDATTQATTQATTTKAVFGTHADAWYTVMIALVLDVCVSLVVLSIFICGIRLIRGPHLADRALAVDTIAVHLVAMVVLLTMRLNLLLLIDGALVLSLLGFAGTVAMSQFILRRRARPTASPPQAQDPAEEPLT